MDMEERKLLCISILFIIFRTIVIIRLRIFNFIIIYNSVFVSNFRRCFFLTILLVLLFPIKKSTFFFKKKLVKITFESI